MKAFIVLLAAGCCVLALSSCGGNDQHLATYRRTAANLTTPLTMHVGETVAITLDENPTTGYSWHRTWVPPAALHEYDYYVADRPIREGSGGVRHFVFEARAAGVVVVTLQYGQWWAGGDVQNPYALPITALP